MTKIKTNLDLGEIEKRVSAGLIRKEKHPFLDLYIYNYTSRVQYDKLWDEYTKACRGLILDGEGNIVAKPFSKFFSLNEVPETRIENLPPVIPSFAEKMDGSLGIQYPENELPAIATRGKFDYNQSMWATGWLRQRMQERKLSLDDFMSGYTYCYEIVYPESKNVVDYGKRAELVLLAVLSNSNGHELNYVEEAENLGFSYAKQYYFSKLSHALEYMNTIRGNVQEGFVCKYPNGLRVKIKSEEYRTLHKMLSNFSARDIWSLLKEDRSIDPVLELVPDEFYALVKKVEFELSMSWEHIMDTSRTVARDASSLSPRSVQAAYVLSHAREQSAVVFPLLDGNEEKARKAAWNMIEPSGEPLGESGTDISDGDY